jgi:hypothetical protein
MRKAISILFMSGLLSTTVMAGGYYRNEPGGRNVIWPPPGGVDRVQPPLWAPGRAAQPDYGSIETPPPRYLPSYRHWGQYVKPPGPGWPEDDTPPAPRLAKPAPLQPGRPVEVVPPPGIPVDEVQQQLSRQPKRGWRPVQRSMQLPAEPEAEQPSPQGEQSDAKSAAAASPPEQPKAQDGHVEAK